MRIWPSAASCRLPIGGLGRTPDSARKTRGSGPPCPEGPWPAGDGCPQDATVRAALGGGPGTQRRDGQRRRGLRAEGQVLSRPN